LLALLLLLLLLLPLLLPLPLPLLVILLLLLKLRLLLLLLLAFDLPGAPATAVETVGRTRRATRMDAGRSRQGQDVPSANPAGSTNP
jgi:hypothetical protein